MSKVEKLAQAIKRIEGWYCVGHKRYPKGSLTYRHHNPGALRWSPFQIGNVNNFAVFENDNKGMEALMWDITCKASNRTRTRLKPESTLTEFAEVWAPASDNNDPKWYAQKIEHFSGLSRNLQLKELLQ